MLVLTRCREQSIMINDDIEVTIVEVCGRKVRIGVTAPKSVPVHRREVYDAIKAAENRNSLGRGSMVSMRACAVDTR